MTTECICFAVVVQANNEAYGRLSDR